MADTEMLSDIQLPHHALGFVCNSNEALHLSLVRSPEDNPESTDFDIEFHPEFTYPIFGPQERIFGYKKLNIKLHYASGSLATYFKLDYGSKYNESSSSKNAGDLPSIEAEDPVGKIKEFIPSDFIENYDQFIDIVKRDAENFRPFGEKIHEYTLRSQDGGMDQIFEIYKTSFESEKFKKYHKRLQIFMLFYVEGASFIDDEDTKWEIYLIYEKETIHISPRYHIVGYATTYPFVYWPNRNSVKTTTSILDNYAARMRVSQFLILLPYQGKGHGNHLYNALYEEFARRKDIVEIVVEDPNDAFSDLRDKNDLRMLLEKKAFEGMKAPVRKEAIDQVRQKYKLTKRQTQRCLEIYLLKNLNKKDKQDVLKYRLQVKQRLFKFNLEALKAFDKIERIDKLHETYQGVVDDYHRILGKI